MVYKSLYELMKVYDTEEKCEEYFIKQRWNDNVECPHCHNHNKIYRFAKGVYKGKFKCENCRKVFSAKTGTYMGESPIKYQKWLMALYLVTSHKKGISSLQLAKDIGVTQKTAWFMLQRIANVTNSSNDRVGGVVEVDEAYIGGKASNKHRITLVNKERYEYQQDKAMLLGMIEREGNLILRKFDKINKVNIKSIVDKHIKNDAVINTDQALVYKGVFENRTRNIVNHKMGQYAIGGFTTNRIECAFSHFKRMINGIHMFLSKKHLQRYADLFSFRMNTKKFDDYERIAILLSGIENTRITYKEVII